MKRKVNAKLSRTQLRKPWSAQFVMSLKDGELPRSMAERDGAREVCKVLVDLAKVHTEVRNHHWWNMGERYELARFEIILTPGPANLKVELLSGEQLVNKEEKPVELHVEWQTGTRAVSVGSMADLDRPYL